MSKNQNTGEGSHPLNDSNKTVEEWSKELRQILEKSRRLTAEVSGEFAAALHAMKGRGAPSAESNADHAAEEPAFVRQVFNVNPLHAARQVLRDETEAAAEQGYRQQEMMGWVRRSGALNVLAGVVASDEDALGEAIDASHNCAMNAARSFAISAADLRAKLALLVRCLVHDRSEDSGTSGVLHLTLAASALADVVIMDGRDISLPADAGQPITSAEDIARMRVRARSAGMAAAAE